jgi:hypothetical protein
MALEELLMSAKRHDVGLRPTGNPDQSLLSEGNVLAVPTCSVFMPQWCGLLANKTVHLMFDNDHPRPHPKSGVLQQPAALAGMKRIALMLSQASPPPSSVDYLRWGRGDLDHDPTLPHGYDVRDKVTS